MKIIVIGGVAGGASAAAKARRINEDAEIVIYEMGAYVSFANCGLPYFVSGEIKERDNLFLMDPMRFRANHNIDVKVLHEVTAIHPETKTVSVKHLQTGTTFEDNYDKLILSPGADALRPPIPGIDAENIFTLKTVPDTDSLKSYIEKNNIKKVAVVGGGFIGLEMVEAFMHLGLEVTLVEMLDQVLPPLDKDMADYISLHLDENNVEVILENGVKEFALEGNQCNKLMLQDGHEIAVDAVVLSIGIKPNIALAQQAGLELTMNDRLVKVNNKMETSASDIYAVGDIVPSVQRVTNEEAWIPLAGPANKQGRVAGTNAAGGDLTMPSVLGTSIARIFKLSAGKTGLSEKEAKAKGIPHRVSYSHSPDHAPYYPGASMLSIKVIFHKDGKLLGAQAIGAQGVDKRIDVFATAIQGGLTVEDLTELDLAYAPPFSSAKDPAIVAGFVANNQFSGAYKAITVEDALKKSKEKNVVLLDVRTPGEYKDGGMEGSINIPLQQLRERYQELDASKEIICYCRIGLRGYLAYRILAQKGFHNLENIMGGMISFKNKA